VEGFPHFGNTLHRHGEIRSPLPHVPWTAICQTTVRTGSGILLK